MGRWGPHEKAQGIYLQMQAGDSDLPKRCPLTTAVQIQGKVPEKSLGISENYRPCEMCEGCQMREGEPAWPGEQKPPDLF